MDDLSPTHLQVLLNQIAQGHDKAMEALYRHYHRQLFAYIRHLVPVDEAAEEILQDTFMAVHNKPLAYNGECKFFTWLCSIAKNKALDWWRTMKRQQTKDMTELDEILADSTPDLSWDVHEHYEHSELNLAIMGCLDKLPDTQREAAYWTFYHDLRGSEVARIAGAPENTIKTRLLHARSKIRDCLERAYPGIEQRRTL
jgi:RNA polymerase sigma-70 factor (ECF subfamily)